MTQLDTTMLETAIDGLRQDIQEKEAEFEQSQMEASQLQTQLQPLKKMK